MVDPTREHTTVEAFEVDFDGDEPTPTEVHLIEKWGTGHRPNARLRRRVLTEDERAAPDSNGGYVTYLRGIITVDGYAWEVKELHRRQIPDNYDDVDPEDVFDDGETRWFLRPIEFEDGHGGPNPKFSRTDDAGGGDAADPEVVKNEPDVDTVETVDDFVIDHAVPEAEAVTWCHVGIDDHYHPKGGYWFPTDVDFDPESSGQVRRKTDIPHGEVIQYPQDPASPEVKGADGDVHDLPDYVLNRIVDRGGA